MRRECAWCHVELEAGPEPTSHGICPACARTWDEKPRVLTIRLARQSVQAEVVADDAEGVAKALVQRLADYAHAAWFAGVGKWAAVRCDIPFPETAAGRWRWAVKRAHVVGIASVWAVEHGLEPRVVRDEEPVCDEAGVFDSTGWGEMR